MLAPRTAPEVDEAGEEPAQGWHLHAHKLLHLRARRAALACTQHSARAQRATSGFARSAGNRQQRRRQRICGLPLGSAAQPQRQLLWNSPGLSSALASLSTFVVNSSMSSWRHLQSTVIEGWRGQCSSQQPIRAGCNSMSSWRHLQAHRGATETLGTRHALALRGGRAGQTPGHSHHAASGNPAAHQGVPLGSARSPSAVRGQDGEFSASVRGFISLQGGVCVCVCKAERCSRGRCTSLGREPTQQHQQALLPATRHASACSRHQFQPHPAPWLHNTLTAGRPPPGAACSAPAARAAGKTSPGPWAGPRWCRGAARRRASAAAPC